MNNFVCPSMRQDSSLLFKLKVCREIKSNIFFIQCAIAFTTNDGCKRTRILNLAMNISNNQNDFFTHLNHVPTLNGCLSTILRDNQYAPYMQKMKAMNDFVIKNKALFGQERIFPNYWYGLTQHPLFNDASLSINMRMNYIHSFMSYSPLISSNCIPFAYKVSSNDSIEQIQLHTSTLSQGIFIVVNNQINVIIPSDIDHSYLCEMFDLDMNQTYYTNDLIQNIESIVDWGRVAFKEAIQKVRYDLYKSLPVVFVVVGSQRWQQLLKKSFIYENNDYQQYL